MQLPAHLLPWVFVRHQYSPGIHTRASKYSDIKLEELKRSGYALQMATVTANLRVCQLGAMCLIAYNVECEIFTTAVPLKQRFLELKVHKQPLRISKLRWCEFLPQRKRAVIKARFNCSISKRAGRRGPALY
jgi:hypothetical protein